MCDLELGKDFLIWYQKHKSDQSDKLDVIKITNYFSKDTVKRVCPGRGGTVGCIIVL